ncbi:MAG TPA: 2OG-Fe(II) oxygenase family protein [Stellaceae bacterium]|nr:2OG-Fe(II) oxygenase family protein [Stellaceae bacterium]
MVETFKDNAVEVLADFDNRARRAALAAKRRSIQTIPTIDFTACTNGGSLEERKRVARALRAACTDTGFFYLANHGISQAEFDVAHAWGLVFFELPRAEKAKLDKSTNPARQGWMPVGGMNPGANPDKDADQKETFVLPRDYLPGEVQGENPAVGHGNWPDPALMPGFRDFIRAHIMKRVAVAQRLVRALALSLDLDEEFLDDAHRYPGISLTYNYYPPLDPETAGRTQWGISPHTDYGSFTLLSQDALGGLEVRNKADEWIDVPPVPGTFVVNIADLFARWTNGVYRSSLHRASNFNTGSRARISLPLFVIPHPKARVECMPTCQGPGNPPQYEPVEAGPYVRALLEQSYRTGRPGVAQKTVEERFKVL